MDSPLSSLNYHIFDTQSDLRNITWNISWGDGSFNEGLGSSLPVHTYTSPGEFKIKLRVSDEEFTGEKDAKATIANVAPSGWIEVLPHGNRNFTEDIWVEFYPHVSDTPSDDSEHEIVWIVDGQRKQGELGTSLFQVLPAQKVHPRHVRPDAMIPNIIFYGGVVKNPWSPIMVMSSPLGK